MSGLKKIIFALLAVTVSAGYIWYANRSVPARQATWDDISVEAEQGGYQIVLTDDLWERYQKGPESALIVDTRQEWEYRTGHIKGAVNFPIEPTWLSRWRNKGALEKLLGPDKSRFIVFY